MILTGSRWIAAGGDDAAPQRWAIGVDAVAWAVDGDVVVPSAQGGEVLLIVGA